MKVAKFGGSSVASAAQFRKVADIVSSDIERRIVVVSAPGKRYKDDVKVTDMLIRLAEQVAADEPYEQTMQEITKRYADIVDELELEADGFLAELVDDLQSKISAYRNDPPRLFDAMKASGEDHNARLMALYLQDCGLEASYVSPLEAGIIVTDEPGNAQVLPESYDKLKQLRERRGVLVIPGFFGYSRSGHIVTFPRGGSDITGSIVEIGRASCRERV